MLSRNTVRVVEVARDFSTINNQKIIRFKNKKKNEVFFIVLCLIYIGVLVYSYIKESSVCWYDGLSCKLND